MKTKKLNWIPIIMFIIIMIIVSIFFCSCTKPETIKPSVSNSVPVVTYKDTFKIFYSNIQGQDLYDVVEGNSNLQKINQGQSGINLFIGLIVPGNLCEATILMNPGQTDTIYYKPTQPVSGPDSWTETYWKNRVSYQTIPYNYPSAYVDYYEIIHD